MLKTSQNKSDETQKEFQNLNTLGKYTKNLMQQWGRENSRGYKIVSLIPNISNKNINKIFSQLSSFPLV